MFIPQRQLRRVRAARTLIFALGLILPACYEYRTSVVNLTPATERSQTLWPLAWGLISKKVKAQCQGQAMSEVTVHDNLGFTLLTVVTLGFLSPKRVEWKCAAPNPAPGSLRPPAAER